MGGAQNHNPGVQSARDAHARASFVAGRRKACEPAAKFAYQRTAYRQKKSASKPLP